MTTGSVESRPRPLRFGILGCGVIGKVHAEAIAGLPDAELVAVADEIPGKAAELATKYPVAAYESLTDLLNHDDLEVVNICTPSGQHGDHAIAVMSSGRHVIVEKPMEIRLDRIDAMLAVQEKCGVKLAVMSQHRFDPAVQDVRRLVEEGAFGRLVLGNAHVLWWRSQGYYDSGAWRGTWELDGGGVLMNQSIHSIDVLQWLMGPVQSVIARSDTLAHTMETEDVAVAALQFGGGALGTIAATTGAYPGVTTRVEFFGDRGSAVIEDDRLRFLRVAGEAPDGAGPYGTNALAATPAASTGGGAQDPAAVPANTHALQIQDMIEAIRENRTPLVDGHAGRRPVEIILAIYESARTGHEVRLG